MLTLQVKMNLEAMQRREVLHIPQNSSITGASPSDCLGHFFFLFFLGGGLTPLQRCSWCILKCLQPLGYKTELMCFNQNGVISSLNGKSLKLIDQFANLVSNISSTESDVNLHRGKAWTAIDKFTMIWKSDPLNKI